jgi:cobalamin biosynthesis protein CobW
VQSQLRPGVKLVRSSNGAVDPAIVLGIGAAAEADMEARRSHHEMEGHEDHDHDDFESFVVEIGAAADRQALIDRVVEAVTVHDVLRLKGFAAIEGADARLVIQAVGPRVTHYFDRPWRPGETRRTALVVIGETGLDRQAIERTLAG